MTPFPFPAPAVARATLARVVVVTAILGLWTWAAAAPLVRVLLADGLEATTIDLPEGHEVRTVRGARTTAWALRWPLEARGDQIVTGDAELGPWIELHPDGGVVRHDGRAYRGGLRIEARGGGLRVINLIDLEAYLRGVVPSEMQASWPLEALKAQAVAARSYTLAALDPTEPYDICASDACQVYRGVAVEHPRADRAVAETEGIVIAWNGAPAAAYYHADSGGVVASSAEVWGRAVPYLPSRTDVAADSPHRGWTVRLSPSALGAALAAEGLGVGTPTGLTVLERTASGRVARAELSGDGGRAVLEGPALTRVLRAAGVKSTRLSVVGGLQVRGDGWGHGVGMSQYGARALAAQGYGYGEILAFYYPGVGLQRRIYRAEAP